MPDRQTWPGVRQRSRTSRDGKIDLTRGPRHVDFGAIHRDRRRRREATASGHLGNVGHDMLTADGLVKAAPRPRRCHTMASFEKPMDAFQGVRTAQRKSDARKTSLSDLAMGGGEALSAVYRSVWNPTRILASALVNMVSPQVPLAGAAPQGDPGRVKFADVGARRHRPGRSARHGLRAELRPRAAHLRKGVTARRHQRAGPIAGARAAPATTESRKEAARGGLDEDSITAEVVRDSA